MIALEVYAECNVRESLIEAGGREDGLLELLALMEEAPFAAEVRVMLKAVQDRIEAFASGERRRLDDDPVTLAYEVLDKSQHEADADAGVQEVLQAYVDDKESLLKEKLLNAADQLVEFANGGGHANMPDLRLLVEAMAEELYV